MNKKDLTLQDVANKIDKFISEQNSRLEEENQFFREIIQDVIDYGRLYHNRKKQLKKYGFRGLK